MSSKTTDDKAGFYLMLSIPIIQVGIWVVTYFLGASLN